MKTIYKDSGATVTLYWKIVRGENKVTEDLSNLKSKVFLIGSCNTYSMEPDVVTDEEFGNKVLKVEVNASMLSTGVYDVKAMWEKNDGRNIMKSARTGVFAITDNSEEVDEIKSEEVFRIASYVESIGRDGLSAYEIAVIRGLNNGLSENDWVGNEAERIKAEQERASAEATREEEEKKRENAEKGRQSGFNAFMDASMQEFDAAQENRAVDFAAAQGGRETSFTDQIQNFEARFNEAEANRNNGEATRNTNYEAAEKRRDGDYATAEANRNKKYNQAEEERDSTIQGKLDDIEGRFTTAENARKSLFNENERTRQQNEVHRINAEGNRQKTFEDNEADREQTFQDNEAERGRNEQTREDNERIRQQAEQARIDTFDENERGRIATFNANEAARIAAENERKQKEVEREANEAIRQESYKDKLPVSAVVQETGDRADLVMSQKAVSEKIKGIDEQIQGTPNYIEGYYLNANGELVSANNYRASDFIELNSSSLTDGIIWTYNDYNSSAKLVLYNANKEVIDNFGMISGAAQRKLSQAQLSNAAYIRISFAGNGKLENPSNWEVIYQTGLIGGIILELKNKASVDSLNKEVNRAMLAEAEIDNKYSVLLSGSPNYTKGGYLNAGGDFILDESYCVSDYIALDIPSLTGGIVWTYGLYNANARLVLYSPDKELIDNYGMLPNSTQRKLSQSQLQNAAYARISFENGTVGKLENASNWSIIYESGEEKGLEASKKQLASILGEDSVIKTATILSTGESLTITEFPKSIQCENQLSFDARVTSWNGGLKIGKGTTDWGASYVTIDDTNVVVQVYQGGSEITKYRRAHGLSFDKFVKVLLNQHSHYLSINIITLNGYFEGEIADFEYKFNGYPIVTSLGASLTDITLSAANHSFQYPIWMFGDSYFGADTENREMYWLREKWGYYKFMLNGFAGRDSSEAYNELTRCLRFGCPKYLVWCLGMNDDDLEIYKQTITDLQGKCDDYGITLLLQTIPTVPVRNKDAMNQYIRESKLRYIDVDASVDADSSGNWYGVGTEYNYLSSDGVHPSEYGARAIAAQFLVDMPEIMQYK